MLALALAACVDNEPEPAEQVILPPTRPLLQATVLGIADEEGTQDAYGYLAYFSLLHVLAFAGRAARDGPLIPYEPSDDITLCADFVGDLADCTERGESLGGGRFEFYPYGVAYLGSFDEVTLGVKEDFTILARAAFVLPGASVVRLPDYHDPGVPLEVDLSGQGFSGSAAVVLDLDGNVLWTDLPQTYEAMEEVNAQTDAGMVVIPGEVLAERTSYLVGIAGTVTNQERDLVDLDPRSRVRAGMLVFHQVSTARDW